MNANCKPPLARLRPRDQLFYVSRNRTMPARSERGVRNQSWKDSSGLHTRLQNAAKAEFEAAAVFEHWPLSGVFSGNQRGALFARGLSSAVDRAGRAVDRQAMRRRGPAVSSVARWQREYKVVRRAGDVHVIRQPSSWSLTIATGERAQDLLASALPRG